MLNVGIIIGSTRPGRKAEAVARWVHEIAAKRGDASYEVVDIAEFKLPHLDEPMHRRWASVQERAAGKKNGGKYAKPEYYDSGRSKELQAYADGIIKTLLEPGTSGP